jgi:hypothetical protein
MSIFAAALALASPPPPSVPTLCDVGVTAFSCETANGKVLSVCSSPALSRESGWVQYRFGRPGAIELTYPPHTEGGDHPFRMLTLLGGPLVDTQRQAHVLDFRVGDVRYQVYETFPVGRTELRPEDRLSAGVRVGTAARDHQPAKVLADIACGPRITGTLAGFRIDWEIAEDELGR